MTSGPSVVLQGIFASQKARFEENQNKIDEPENWRMMRNTYTRRQEQEQNRDVQM